MLENKLKIESERTMKKYKCGLCSRKNDEFCIVETFQDMEDQSYYIYTGDTNSAVFIEVK